MTSDSRSEAKPPATGDGQPLSGRRVLIVEDDPFISLDLEEILKTAGVDVVGRSPSVEVALEMIETTRPDAVLLDLNLRGTRATPVALALKAAGIPFVLTSGYSRSQIDEPSLDDILLVPKPVQPRTLLAGLRGLFET